MAEIFLPFKIRFISHILDGTKTMTARSKKLGKVGDTFVIVDRTFVLTDVRQRKERWVAEHWKAEGCDNRADWLAVWNAIHPLAGYRPDQLVWVHRWKPIGSISPAQQVPR